VTLHVLDRDNQWWRAASFRRDDFGIRLNHPEILSKGRNWVPYSEGIGRPADSVYVPITFVKREVS
jgi:hypothetical protein